MGKKEISYQDIELEFNEGDILELEIPPNIPGKDGSDGKDGNNGKSAYEIALGNGFIGSESEWIESLSGKDGKDGIDGKDGSDGKDGKDGKDGSDGKDGRDGVDGKDGKDGENGKDGLSAYEIAVKNGFEGTEKEWLKSLKGKDGKQGIRGEDGRSGLVQIGGGGAGDMIKAVYDTDNDGVVDSAETVRIIVRNSTGSTLTKGQVVYLQGATGNRPNALLADASTEATSSKTIGIVIADIANNSDGYVATHGTLHDLDLSMFSAGDRLWLSETAGGMVANTPPPEPAHSVFIGTVARSHPTQGRIVLAIQNGYELDELHGVKITTPTDSQLLRYNETNGLWENKFTWEFLVTNWTTEPTLNTTIAGGEVYNYTLRSTTRYRFVPTTYNPTQDAFYSTFSSGTLSNLIVTRG